MASSLSLFLRVNVLSVLLLCYLLLLLLGGLLFRALEQPAERRLRLQVEELRRSFLLENPCVEEKSLDRLLGRLLSSHHRNLAVLEEDADDRRYDFTSSLYFVIVTLTTTGSDSYSLRSEEAKLFSVFYCSLGIPLTLLLLTHLSHLLFPLLLTRPLLLLQDSWGLPRQPARLLHTALLGLLLLGLLLLLPALLLCTVEPDWSFLDALFFCFITLSTVGEGGREPGGSWGPRAKETLQLLTTGYLLLGLLLLHCFRTSVLRLPLVCSLLRLLSPPRLTHLQGINLGHMTSEEHWEEEQEQEEGEEAQYSQSVCTISSSCPWELMEVPTEVHSRKPA